MVCVNITSFFIFLLVWHLSNTNKFQVAKVILLDGSFGVVRRGLAKYFQMSAGCLPGLDTDKRLENVKGIHRGSNLIHKVCDFYTSLHTI